MNLELMAFCNSLIFYISQTHPLVPSGLRDDGSGFMDFGGCPKLGGTFLGVSIIRIIVFWGLYWGPLILGNYHFGLWGLVKQLYTPNLGFLKAFYSRILSMWSDKRRAVETLRFTLLLEVGAQDWELEVEDVGFRI